MAAVPADDVKAPTHTPAAWMNIAGSLLIRLEYDGLLRIVDSKNLDHGHPAKFLVGSDEHTDTRPALLSPNATDSCKASGPRSASVLP